MADPEYVIIPTTDLMQRFREDLVSATNIHIDWEEVGNYLVDSTLTSDHFEKALFLSEEETHRQTGDDWVEFRAMTNLLKSIEPLFQAIGYYKRPDHLEYAFDRWLGEDLVISKIPCDYPE